MMLSKRWQGLLMMCLAVTLTLAYASPAFAQRDTGVMVVRAIDPDGAPLPGVQVVATGPVGTQTQYTGIDGTARFPGLYPGEGYIATFTLDGFKTVIREGLEIGAGRTTAFDLTMELATVEETITVTGESPIVDVKSTDIAGLYSDDLIDMTPTASGIWAGVLDHVPGVMASLDVGGGDSGQQTSPRAWGSETWNNSYNVNGGDTTDPAATGASSSYFSVGSFEEVSVSLAAQDIEIKTPGVNMNMVVKSGSNDWHAGVKYFYEGEGMVSSNVDDALREEGITEGTPNKKLSDLDVQGGGPIVRNRAWFFVDYWNFEIQKLRIGITEEDGTKLKDWTLNINAQISDNHKVSGRYINTAKYRNDRGASSDNPYIGRIQDSSTHIPQLQWQAVVNQNIFTDIRFSTVRSNFPLERRDGQSRNPMPGYTNLAVKYNFSESSYVDEPVNPVSEFFDERDTDSLNGTASWYITGERVSNDIKFGGNYQKINYFAPSNNPWGHRPYVRTSRVGDPAYDPNNNPNWAVGVPVEVRLYNKPTATRDNGVGPDCFVLNTADCWYPNNAYNIKGAAYGLFFQDTITLGTKTTIIAGFRWDQSYNYNPAQNRLDSPWCNLSPALQHPEQFCGGEFEKQDRPFTYNNLTPRVGVVYDVLGDGRWALKANFAIYTEQLGTYGAGSTNVNGTGREDWNWVDANGDGIFQYGEQTTYRDRSFPGLGTSFDPGYTSPLVNELTLGVDHEVFDNILLSATFITRGKYNADGYANIGRPWGPMFSSERCMTECDPVLPYGVDPWFEVITVDPGNDGIIGNADDGGPVPVWALNNAAFGSSNNIVTNSAEFNLPSETDYKGLSLVLSKRWADNWQVLASYDYGKSYYSGDYGATSPNGWYNDRKNQGFGSRPHMFKVTGNYLIAEPIGVNLGLFIRAQSGEPVRSQYSYDDSVLNEGSPFDDQSNTTIYIDPRGEGNEAMGRPAREDFVTLVDIRAEKQFTIGKYGVLHFYFDVFNLFNANTVTEFRWWLGSRYMETYDILPPRVIRLGGAWDF